MMTKRPFYSPTRTDIMWAMQMVDTLAEGGVLAFPATQLIYRVSHKAHKLVLTNEEVLFEFDSFVTHLQTIWTFEAIGFEVLPDVREDVDNAPDPVN